MLTHNQLEAQIGKLLAYCQANEWAGYDPCDAVNSRVFTLLPFLNSRLDPSNIELARSVFQWAVNHLWDERGFFTTASFASALSEPHT
jgi:hypothetical protein